MYVRFFRHNAIEHSIDNSIASIPLRTEHPKKLVWLVYCDVWFTAMVWNRTRNTCEICLYKQRWGLPWLSVERILPANAETWVRPWSRKSPHVTGQLRLCAPTTEPTWHRAHAPQEEKPTREVQDHHREQLLTTTRESPEAATNTLHSRKQMGKNNAVGFLGLIVSNMPEINY